MTAVEATAWTIEADDERKMRVSRENGHTDFKWLCGDERSFLNEDVAEAIANLELLESHSVWLRLRDRHGSGLVAMVVDDRFYAALEPDDDPQDFVAWPALRELLWVEPEPEPEPEPSGTAGNTVPDETAWQPTGNYRVRERRGGLRAWLRDRGKL